MRVEIISNVWSRVDPDHVEPIRKLLSYEEVIWQKIPGYSKSQPVRKRHTLAGKNGFFFSGYVPYIKKYFPDVQIIEKRREHLAFEIQYPDKLGNEEGRLYQKKMVQIGIKERRGVIQSPTGSGKTWMEAAVFYAINERGLLIVNGRDLLTQIRKSFYKLLNCPIGIIGGGECKIEIVTVATIQSLANLSPDVLKQFDFKVVIVDECHHVSARSYMNTLLSIDAPFRLGFSATPKEETDAPGDYLKVHGVLGPIIGRVEHSDVKGFISEVAVRIIDYEGPDFSKYSSWRSVYQYGLVRNAARNLAIARVVAECRDEFGKNASILIMVTLVEHGFILQKLIPGSYFVHGSNPMQLRNQIKARLKKGGIVIATSVFGEGVDIPSLNVLVNAGAGLSRFQTIQRAGRVLRAAPGKDSGLIVDFFDDANKYLLKHSRARILIYKKLGWYSGV
jgi:superfamily II DNA or RNA helicase